MLDEADPFDGPAVEVQAPAAAVLASEDDPFGEPVVNQRRELTLDDVDPFG